MTRKPEWPLLTGYGRQHIHQFHPIFLPKEKRGLCYMELNIQKTKSEYALKFNAFINKL